MPSRVVDNATSHEETPWAPRGTLSKDFFLSMCLRGLIIVLFCRIHGLDVHVPVWSSQNVLGPQKRE